MAHDSAGWRILVLSKHLPQLATPALPLQASNCLAYEPPEANSGNSASPAASGFVEEERRIQ